MKKIAWCMACLLSATLVFAQSRTIVDMAGRKVVVPQRITRLYAPSPYGAYMMYALSSDLMTGLIFAHQGPAQKFLPRGLEGKPVIGGVGGHGPNSNPEMLLKTRPEVLIMWKNDRNPVDDRADGHFARLNIPQIYVEAANMYEYPEAVRFLGRLLHREQRAEKMAALFRRIIDNATMTVSRIPANQRPRVYYAEGVDGLSTECNDSIHVELFRIAGDVDIHRCHTASHMGMEKISLEQVLMYNPDVIVAQEKMFVDKVYGDPAWRAVKAVREHRVFLIPRQPFNWFDRPPSYMRFMGLVWLMHNLYPRQYKVDLAKETKNFYLVTLGVRLSDSDLREILQ